jgi:hypothetical protein
MRAKVREKAEAVKLRHNGYSYNDILKEVPVAKSSLSLWLKDEPLTDEEKRYLKRRKNKNINRGRIKTAAAHRKKRLEREKIIFEEAKEEFKYLFIEPFFQVGVALYWAEGAKRNGCFDFTNSDPEMIKIMMVWIDKYLDINKNDLGFRLYIHKQYAHEECEEFWADLVGISVDSLKKTVYKPSTLTYRKRPSYKGCFKITTGKKRIFLRMIFWQKLLFQKHILNSNISVLEAPVV